MPPLLNMEKNSVQVEKDRKVNKLEFIDYQQFHNTTFPGNGLVNCLCSLLTMTLIDGVRLVSNINIQITLFQYGRWIAIIHQYTTMPKYYI